MKFLFLTILFLVSSFCSAYSQEIIDSVSSLKLKDCKLLYKDDDVSDNVFGHNINMIEMKITAKTFVQISCKFGGPFVDPLYNPFNTVDNQILISYFYDSLGIFKNILLNKYKNQQLNSDLVCYYKSQMITDDTVVPLNKLTNESEGAYLLFYFDKKVYKIELLESHGYGCLSSFIDQNAKFTANGKLLKVAALH